MNFFGKVPKFFVGALLVLLQISNSFLENIVVFEVTGGVKFDWRLLLTNRLFWLYLALMLVYYMVAYIANHRYDTVDEELEKAITMSSVKLVDSIGERGKKEEFGKGDFESSKRLIKTLKKLQRMRRGR